jgi:group I intron endonuclease
MVIYKIEIEGNEEFYIGSAHVFHKRKIQHLGQLRRGNHRNIHLQRLFDKHGEESLSFHILEEVVGDNEDLLEKEQEWIDKYDFSKLINICPTAGNTAGRKHTEKSKMLISKNHADVSGENNPMFGKSGELSPNYGKKHSEETKRKISEATKGRKSWSEGKKRPEHSEKMKGENNPFYGKTHTDEAKKKLSEIRKKAAREKGGKKLTIELAREIRARYNSEEDTTIAQLARDYGISRSFCSGVIKNIYWSDND